MEEAVYCFLVVSTLPTLAGVRDTRERWGAVPLGVAAQGLFRPLALHRCRRQTF